MSYADRTIDYNGVALKISEVPDVYDRAMLGYGHWPSEIAQRPVVTMSGRVWPYSPETCLTDDYIFTCEWFDEHTLVCPGCGLDCT